ncbi:bzip transcription factor [Niveomyces insectorum RCEF 264]|uniref:Bzip transcription factor n=1 Tax=Niveomyces insectorum RCEF 264 TaxID=1081102 RepID=A0A167PRM3_9HYPO|nr:bzip transcription factor [Niveomyces insectorum RCEF 264]
MGRGNALTWPAGTPRWVAASSQTPSPSPSQPAFADTPLRSPDALHSPDLLPPAASLSPSEQTIFQYDGDYADTTTDTTADTRSTHRPDCVPDMHPDETSSMSGALSPTTPPWFAFRLSPSSPFSVPSDAALQVHDPPPQKKKQKPRRPVRRTRAHVSGQTDGGADAADAADADVKHDVDMDADAEGDADDANTDTRITADGTTSTTADGTTTAATTDDAADWRARLLFCEQAPCKAALPAHLVRLLDFPPGLDAAELAARRAANLRFDRVREQRLKDRNNEAAKRSRQRKVQRIAEAERQVALLVRERAVLAAEVTRLRSVLGLADGGGGGGGGGGGQADRRHDHYRDQDHVHHDHDHGHDRDHDYKQAALD